jgi:hypothetical protein
MVWQRGSGSSIQGVDCGHASESCPVVASLWSGLRDHNPDRGIKIRARRFDAWKVHVELDPFPLGNRCRHIYILRNDTLKA